MLRCLRLVTYTVGVVERAIAMELTLVELSFVDDAIRELEFTDTLGPFVFGGTYEVTARPL